MQPRLAAEIFSEQPNLRLTCVNLLLMGYSISIGTRTYFVAFGVTRKGARNK